MNHEVNEPEILEAEWDREQVNVFFSDLELGAEIEHVQVRSVSGAVPQDRKVTLREAHELLTLGEAKAIQIRYQFDGENWCDTLMVSPTTVRIVRTRSVT